MPHTSSGGQFLGFEIDRSRGKRKIRQKKGKRREELEKRKQIYSHSLLAVR